MRRLITFVLAMSFIAFASAQEEQKPVKYENVDWCQVVMIKFKTGEKGKIKEIIKKYEEAADKAKTSKPEMHWLVTGKYDMMLIWELKDGPADLEWKYSAEGIKWWKAFVELSGGKEKAEEIQKEYTSRVMFSESFLTRRPK